MKRLILALILIWVIYIIGRELFFQVSYLWLPASLILSNPDVALIEDTVLDEFKILGKDTKIDIVNDDYKLTDQYVDIDGNGRKDLVVTMQAASTCGSAGCMTKIFMQQDDKKFTPLNFTHAVESIEVLQSITNGMRDLRVNNDTNSRLSWNGLRYELETI